MSNKNTDNKIEFSDCKDCCKSCTDNFNPLLRGIKICDREELDDQRATISYRKGDVIFKENTFPSGLFCLNAGNVMITVSDIHGNRMVTNLYKGVTFLGISDYLSDQPYQSTCIALSDVKACMIKSNAVDELISKNTAFARKLLTTVARDYLQGSKRLLAITKKNMNSRLADALLELIDVFGTDENGVIDVYLRRLEISQLCNMSESNVIKHLSELNKIGAIKIDSKKIIVLNKEALVKESMSSY